MQNRGSMRSAKAAMKSMRQEQREMRRQQRRTSDVGLVAGDGGAAGGLARSPSSGALILWNVGYGSLIPDFANGAILISFSGIPRMRSNGLGGIPEVSKLCAGTTFEAMAVSYI